MTRTIDFPPDVDAGLSARAALANTTVEALVVDLARRHASGPTLEELMAPFRQSIAENGVTDEELAGLVEEAREEVWREKSGGGP